MELFNIDGTKGTSQSARTPHIIGENDTLSENANADKLKEKTDMLKRVVDEVKMTSEKLKSNRETALMAAEATFMLLEEELHRRKKKILREIDEEFSSKYEALNQQKRELEHLISCTEVNEDSTHKTIENGLSVDDFARSASPRHQAKQEAELLTNQLKDSTSKLEHTNDILCGKNPNAIKANNDGFSNNALNNIACCCYRPLQNPCLSWKPSPGDKQLCSAIKDSEIGHIVYCHAVAHKSNIVSDVIDAVVSCDVGVEQQVVLTTKDHRGKVTNCCPDGVEVELLYCSDSNGKENLLVSSNREPQSTKSEEISKHCSFGSKSFSAPGLLVNSKNISQPGDKLHCEVETVDEGKYVIKFTNHDKYNYLLTAKVHGLDVINSPAYVIARGPAASTRSASGSPRRASDVTKCTEITKSCLDQSKSKNARKQTEKERKPDGCQLLMQVGCKGRKAGEFTNPQDVATDHSGKIYVTDSNNQNIQVFKIDPCNIPVKFESTFGKRGRGLGQLFRPTGITLLPTSDVAVSDYENKVVNIYSANGKFLSKIGSGKLLGPRGVCLTSEGDLIVVDNKQCEIFIFNTNGKLLRRFGGTGTGDHQLAGPHYAAVNQDNEIFITDFYSHCVKVFTMEGKYLRSFGGHGSGRGKFNGPTGICVDQTGHVIVADWGNHRIQVFRQDGTFLNFIKTEKSPLYGPQGVAIFEKGRVAVVDTGHQCVKVYKINFSVAYSE